MKKNKKGFTLVELIVTIAILLIVLVIAIVSVSKLSEKNKEKSWNEVKSEVKLAAKEYFETNEYQLENLQGDGVIKLGVGRLVEEDLINIVTNPKTGKKINYCDYIYVSKKDGKFTYSYVESKDEECPNPKGISFEEIGSPSLELSKTCSTNKGKNGWCIGDIIVKAVVKTNNFGPISNVSSKTFYSSTDYENNLTKENNVYTTEKITEDGKNIKTIVTAINTSGKKAIKEIFYDIDKKAPECSDQYEIINNNRGKNLTAPSDDLWTNKDRRIELTCNDITSGCNSVFSIFRDTLKVYENQEIEDNAGNKNTCNLNVYVDKQTPSINKNIYYASNEKINSLNSLSSIDAEINNINNSELKEYNDASWLNKSFVVRVDMSDNFSGIKTMNCVDSRKSTNPDYSDFETYRRVRNKSEGVVTFVCTAKDKAGNTKTQEFVVKRDITAPEIDLNAYVDNEDNIRDLKFNEIKLAFENNKISKYVEDSWTNKNVIVALENISDRYSGLNEEKTKCVSSSNENLVEKKYVKLIDESKSGTFNYECIAYDKAGNKSVINKTVKRDLMPPVCGNYTSSDSVDLTNASINRWTSNDRVITQECSDPNGSGCSKKSKTFSSSTEKSTIEISDAAGNKRTCNVNVFVDKGVPSVTVSMYKNESSCAAATTTAYTSNSWYNKNVHTKVNVTNETISGIALVTYKLNDDSEVSATNKTICTEGQHTIKYKVCNNAGTCNETSNSYVNLDHTKPNIELLVYQGSNDDVSTLDSIEKINAAISNKTVTSYTKNNWTNKSIVMKVNSSDEDSGLKSYSCTDYRYDVDHKNRNFAERRRIVNDWNGEYKFDCEATDIAGNKTTYSYESIKRDTVVPTCSISTTGTLKTISKNDNNVINIKKDKSGMYIPELTINNSKKYVSNAWGEDEKVTGWYSSNVSLTLTYKDNLSSVNEYGLVASNYLINGETTGSQTNDTKGTAWGGMVKDKAGNKGYCKIRIKKDATKPVTNKTGAGPVNCKGTTGELEYGYSVQAYDATSGVSIRFTQYYSDDNCTDYHWAGTGKQKSYNAGTNPYGIYSIFAKCSNNPSPSAKYILVDYAGNYTSEALIQTNTASKTSLTNPPDCVSTEWWNSATNSQ